jgi:hypothetical protein
MSIPVSDDSNDLQDLLLQDAEEFLSSADSFDLHIPSNEESTQCSPDFDKWAYGSPVHSFSIRNAAMKGVYKSASKSRKKINVTAGRQPIKHRKTQNSSKRNSNHPMVESKHDNLDTPSTMSIPVALAFARQKAFIGSDTLVNQLTAIPADDMRRQFVLIVENAINSDEFGDLQRLLTSHAAKDVIVVSRCYDSTSSQTKLNPCGSPYIEVRGLDAVLIYLEAVLTSIPDAIIDCFGTQIRACSSGKSMITCKFSLKCTKTVELAGDQSDILIVSIPKDVPADPFGDKVFIIPLDQDRHMNLQAFPTERIFLRGCQKSEAIGLDTEGILMFFIDSSKKIKRIEIMFSIQRRYRVSFSDEH